MKKREFLAALREKLSGLPQEDREERLSFYEEMIDDRMEDGLSEEDAVAEIGSVDHIAAQIMAEIPLTKLVREKVRRKRKLKAWEIVLLVLGSPLWLPLLLACFAVVLSVYLVLWAVTLSLWAVELFFAANVPVCLVGAVVSLGAGNLARADCVAGIGLLYAGLSIFLFFGCARATKGSFYLTKKLLSGVKSRLMRKERSENAYA